MGRQSRHIVEQSGDAELCGGQEAHGYCNRLNRPHRRRVDHVGVVERRQWLGSDSVLDQSTNHVRPALPGVHDVGGLE